MRVGGAFSSFVSRRVGALPVSPGNCQRRSMLASTTVRAARPGALATTLTS